ncbi:integrase domain-containing protein [Paraburkholderia sp. LEh10]|uniref:phage integrase N-terminal domain-containing protein n=1 Tax=Paraburkholderia sp. LEh10 TaxID=2821353 RepID=UPI001AE134ED|nr:phage integrase N-terminal domain-containing protein [Paraburkholderia sp. LEh10]MBP0596341.1 integrase domain-containing protein [Paraburkholderia sp. LEh10]
MTDLFKTNGKVANAPKHDGHTSIRHGNWKKQLADMLKQPENQRTVRGDRRASDNTQETRANILFQGFRDLRVLGYRFDTITSFRQKHMQALVNKWLDERMAASTIQGRMTTFRTFCNWIGKCGLIGPTAQYVKDPKLVKRALSAQTDKSWSGNGVNVDEKLAEIRRADERAGLMLLAGSTWGLRRLEMVCLRPYATVVVGSTTNIVAFSDVKVSREELKAAIAASGSGLPIKKGTKGGRYRVLPLDTPEKLDVLRQLQAVVQDRDGFLGWPGESLKTNARRLSYIAKKFGLTKADLGVTLHGLRHEVANNEFERLSGVQSAIRGGNSPLRGEKRVAAQLVAQLLGHSRVSIASAYCGSVVNMGEIQKNRAIAELDALQPHLDAFREALERHGFVSLYMVGARAMGKCRPQDATVPYEFMTFGESGQPTLALRAELEALLSTPVYVRIMAEETDEASATFLNNMLRVVDGSGRRLESDEQAIAIIPDSDV